MAPFLALASFVLACFSEQLWAVALTGPLCGAVLTMWMVGPMVLRGQNQE